MFQLDEIVMIKRTGGKWEEGTVLEVNDYFVVVHVDVTDTFRGQPWNGEPMKAIKRIPINEADNYIQKMKMCIKK